MPAMAPPDTPEPVRWLANDGPVVKADRDIRDFDDAEGKAVGDADENIGAELGGSAIEPKVTRL